jgi:hypothetical protein
MLSVFEYHNGANLLAVDIEIKYVNSAREKWGVDAECKVIIAGYPDTKVFENGYDEIMTTLNIAYDPGYGTQHVYGTVWFENGIWATRHEYDGSEGWELHVYPTVPKRVIEIETTNP